MAREPASIRVTESNPRTEFRSTGQVQPHGQHQSTLHTQSQPEQSQKSTHGLTGLLQPEQQSHILLASQHTGITV